MTAATTSPPPAAPPCATARLVESLRDPACYPHPVGAVEVRETHISFVLLAGEFAYKVKKALRLPFLDFSTLGQRLHCCHEEVRLNARTAPALYLGVVPITAEGGAIRVDGAGEPVEYAVRMRRFAPGALLGEHARAGTLEPGHVDALARRLAEFHRLADVVARDPGGSPGGHAADSAIANFTEVAALAPRADLARLAALREWTRAQSAALEATFTARMRAGHERECHGDLHLDNVALVDGEPTIFDCIEFSRALRCTDVAADVAFAAMDLERHRLPRLAARFVNGYLEATGDYGMLAVLRFYAVYRAMVRAKVALLRAHQGAQDGVAAHEAWGEFHSHLGLAERLAERSSPVMVLMQGLSGSGKTTASERLLEALGAVRLRSDVERKRLHGLRAQDRAAAAPGEGIYGEREARDTYSRLADLARGVLAAGYPVVVDATFLRRADRERFRGLARSVGAAFEIVACTAPADVLRDRVAERERGAADASDAGLAVLGAQLGHLEPLGEDERRHATFLDTSAHEWKSAAESLARRFHLKDV